MIIEGNLFFLIFINAKFQTNAANFREYARIVLKREVNNYSLHIYTYICVYDRQTRIDNITPILIERVVWTRHSNNAYVYGMLFY